MTEEEKKAAEAKAKADKEQSSELKKALADLEKSKADNEKLSTDMKDLADKLKGFDTEATAKREAQAKEDGRFEVLYNSEKAKNADLTGKYDSLNGTYEKSRTEINAIRMGMLANIKDEKARETLKDQSFEVIQAFSDLSKPVEPQSSQGDGDNLGGGSSGGEPPATYKTEAELVHAVAQGTLKL